MMSKTYMLFRLPRGFPDGHGGRVLGVDERAIDDGGFGSEMAMSIALGACNDGGRPREAARVDH